MIEITTFRPAEGAADEDLLEADRLVQQRFMPRQPGFLRRTTARGADGEWAVVVLWAGEAEALAAAEGAVADPSTAALAALVDPSTLQVRRYTELG